MPCRKWPIAFSVAIAPVYLNKITQVLGDMPGTLAASLRADLNCRLIYSGADSRRKNLFSHRIRMDVTKIAIIQYIYNPVRKILECVIAAPDTSRLIF